VEGPGDTIHKAFVSHMHDKNPVETPECFQFMLELSAVKLLPEPNGPVGSNDVHFSGPQLTTDTGLVHRVVRLSTPQPQGRYQIILLGDRGT